MTSRPVDSAVGEWIRLYGGEEVVLGELLCDAHASGGAVALVYDGKDGRRELTYAELGERSTRLAGALCEAGIAAGDRVAVMLPKSGELLVALLAIWRLGAVHVPLFTAFGPDAAGYRLRHSGSRLVITDTANRGKVGADALRVVCVGRADAGDLDFAQMIERGPATPGVARRGDDALILLYTSGTTGHPKGVDVPVKALASIHSYMRHGLDLDADDVFWNVADPGWAYGLWFGVVGPLLLGRTTLLRSMPFDPGDVCEAILAHGVTNLTGAPTVYRALRATGVPRDFARRSCLRIASSAGEPLNTELLAWSTRELGVAIHDHYGQSELGMPVGFAHHPELERNPVAGSMGFSAPGYRTVVLGEQGEELPAAMDGDLAIDVDASPLYWFRGYFEDAERTAERFPHGPRYYLTGDAARSDENGLFYFASRTDDVITSSGYRIGPFEVESALMAHPAVAEVAVVGTPDALRGEAVTAFVVTAPAVSDVSGLAEELQSFVKSRLAAHLFPRRVCFVEALPRTPSGKIRRTELRRQWHASRGRSAPA